MATCTFNDLLNDFAKGLNLTRNSAVIGVVAGATMPDDLWHEQVVGLLNQAIEWVWTDEDPRFAWPCTLLTNSAITVSGNTISPSQVSNSEWVSFWYSDPRIPWATVTSGWFDYCQYTPPVSVTWDGQNFYVQDNTLTGPTFAFYRAPTPQGVFALASTNPTYATPTVPDFFRDAIVFYALSNWHRQHDNNEAADRNEKRFDDWFYRAKAAVLNDDSRAPWGDNVVIAD